MNIEPSELGKTTATTLNEKFRGELDERTRDAWCGGFTTAMHEYMAYANGRIRMLDAIKPEYLALKPVTDDVRKFLAPKKSWASMI